MQRRRSLPNRLRRKAGLTMIELLVGLGIMALLIALALPSMNEFIARQRLVGVATELATDLRFARSEQMKSSKPVSITFGNTSSRSCYMVHNFIYFTSCSCARPTRPYCSARTGVPVPTELKTVDLPVSGLITVRPLTGTPSTLIFEASTGLVIGTDRLTINVESTIGGHLRVLTGAAGQPSICSVSGHSARFPECPT